jgi:hypothetical protein
MKRGRYIALVLLLFATNLRAQTAKFTGTAVDSSGALIVGADVTLIGQGNTPIAITRTGPDGMFNIEAPPGSYALEISAEGFEKSVRGISIAANNNRPITVSLSIAKITQEVEVQDNPNLISLNTDNNQTALVLREDDVQSLPEDEDELTAYLTDLAGPRAAATGGVQFVVDGFLGGRIPPKDQIKEIRINNNPFTTEFSRPGFGRIEIITKPGTGKMRGNFNFNFRNDALNATQFNAPVKLPYQRQNFQGNVSGPLVRDKLTMTIFAQRFDAFNTSIIRALTGNGLFSSSVTQPNLRENLDTRGQYALTPNNTLNFHTEYGSNTRSNQGIGQFTLPERASNFSQKQYEVQFRDTAVLSTRFVHEARFEYTRQLIRVNLIFQAQSINVVDTFSAGGAQNTSNTTNNNFLFGDSLIFNNKSMTVKTGLQGNYYRTNAYNANNFLGTFTFSSLSAYLAGTPTTFTMNVGNPLLLVSQWEWGLFTQSDIKLSDRLLISPGLRYQLQSHLTDHHDVDPRVSLSYQLNKVTIVRLGAGLFHQNFSIANYLQIQQLNGINQTQILIRQPSYPDPFAGGMAQSVPPSLRTMANGMVTSYNSNLSGSVERQLNSRSTLSVAYDYIRGNHLYRSRNINAPLPPNFFVRPNPAQGNIYQLESSGLGTFKGVTFGYRTQLNSGLNLFVNYTYSTNYNDTDGPFSLPANNYDSHSEWGRSPDNHKHYFQTGINGRLPGDIFVNTQFRVYSGKPYNITTGYDNFNDGVTNARPDGVSRNSAEGPGFFDSSINFAKTITVFRSKEAGPLGFPGGGGFGNGGQRGPGGPGGRPAAGSFGGGGRGGPIGGQRGGGRGGANPNVGTTATFYTNIQNVFNHRNFNNPSGVLTSPFFGESTSALAPRTVELGVRLNF